jgi:hypothetical protein
VLTSIDPTFGSTAGNTIVTLLGDHFDITSVVEFDGQPGNILFNSSTEIRVQTPATLVEGIVDVDVSTINGSDTLPSAYTYWQDGTGLYGMAGTVEWDEYMGGYWTGPTQVGYADFWFTEPTSLPTWELRYSTGMDQCELDYIGPNFNAYLPGSPTLSMSEAGGTAFNVTSDPVDSWYYSAGPLTAADLKLGAPYTLQPAMGADPSWPQFTAPDVLELPNSMYVTNPVIDAPNAPYINRTFNLQWSGPYTGDYVTLILIHQRWNGAINNWDTLETQTCVLTDDGFFTVPGNQWTSWNASLDGVIIAAGRAMETTGTLPFNNATSNVLGAYYAIGFGLAQ